MFILNISLWQQFEFSEYRSHEFVGNRSHVCFCYRVNVMDRAASRYRRKERQWRWLEQPMREKWLTMDRMTGPVTWFGPRLFIYSDFIYLFICSIRSRSHSSEPTVFYRTSFYVKLGRLHFVCPRVCVFICGYMLWVERWSAYDAGLFFSSVIFHHTYIFNGITEAFNIERVSVDSYGSHTIFSASSE